MAAHTPRPCLVKEVVLMPAAWEVSHTLKCCCSQSATCLVHFCTRWLLVSLQHAWRLHTVPKTY